jgi:hypothetical protein
MRVLVTFALSVGTAQRRGRVPQKDSPTDKALVFIKLHCFPEYPPPTGQPLYQGGWI